jgi:hypothetical protein
MMAVNVSTGTTFKAGIPHPLFAVRRAGGNALEGIWVWDLTTDGKRFLINAEPEENGSTPIRLVQNWTLGLKK